MNSVYIDIIMKFDYLYKQSYSGTVETRGMRNVCVCERERDTELEFTPVSHGLKSYIMPTISNSRCDIMLAIIYRYGGKYLKMHKIVKIIAMGTDMDIGGGWHVGECGIAGIFKVINIINIFNSTYVYIIFDKKIK